VRELLSADEGLRELARILGDRGLLQWALSGGASDPVLASLLPPVPPPELRRLSGEPEHDLFLWTGAADADVLLAEWEAHGLETPGRPPSVLDFGCGCGRLLRFLTPAADIARIHGADPDRAAAEWCRAHLPGAAVEISKPDPPLPWADSTFDLVLAVSVLSHLPEATLPSWLLELARVTRPGGLLVATVHGVHAAARLEREQAFAQAPPAQARLGPRLVPEAEVRGLASSAGFALVSLAKGGLRGWQDILVARRAS
jgi:SAM-dependent methyltransferase